MVAGEIDQSTTLRAEPVREDRQRLYGEDEQESQQFGQRTSAINLPHLQRRPSNGIVSIVGNGAVGHPNAPSASVQRNGEGDPALVRQYENELAKAERDASQNDDLMLRAHSNRLALLLKYGTRPVFDTQQRLDAFLNTADRQAVTELDTLSSLGRGADLALATTPKGFPLTWAGRIHAALTLGIDPAAVLAEAVQQRAALAAQAEQLPPRLSEKGLPVPMAELAELANFNLRVTHTQAPQGSPVGDFARATARYAQFRFYASFAFSWERLAQDVRQAVADGTYVPRYHDYTDFVQNRQRILRELPARARERLAASDEEMQGLQRDAVGLADAALVAGVVAGLGSLFGVLDAWSDGDGLFQNALRTTDGLVAQAGDGDRIVMAFRWLWEAGYIGAAGADAIQGLIASGPDMLKALAAIVVLQMIPGVNVAVDVYLMVTLGTDILAQLTELGLAFGDITSARSVVQLQRAAGRMARSLTAGGIQILTTLVAKGVARGAASLRGRAARLQAANPALSEEEALRQAMREATPAERAALEATADLSSRQLAQHPKALRREFAHAQASARRRPLQDPVYDEEVILESGHVWRRQRDNGRWCRFSSDPLCFIFGEGPGGSIETFPASRKARQGMWSGTPGNSEFTPNNPVALRRANYQPIVYRNGYPDFTPFAVEGGKVLLPRDQLAIRSRSLHDRLADTAFARRRGWLLPNGQPDVARATAFRTNPADPLTWHHMEGDNILLLVPRPIHQAAQHAGGFSRPVMP